MKRKKPMQYKNKRGLCKFCGLDKHIRKDGNLASHQSALEGEGFCEGSGRPPDKVIGDHDA